MRFGRALIVPVVLVVLVVAAALGAGRSKPTKSGQNLTGPRPTVAFGTQLEQIPSPAGLDYMNGWAASAGRRQIGVYVGSAASNHHNGVLSVARLTPGKQRFRSFVLHGSGPVTLLPPPRPVSEAAAWNQTIRFVTANGGAGTLDLATDKVTLSH